MIRLSRMADYALVLMARMAHDQEAVHNAFDMSGATGVPTPTVSKVLATLARHGLLHSVRGAKGGYRLAAGPQDISVAEIISVIDGPIALTQCIEHAPGVCEIESLCPCRQPWQVINDVVRRSLEGVSLADIAAPMPSFPAFAHRGRGAPHITSGSHG